MAGRPFLGLAVAVALSGLFLSEPAWAQRARGGLGIDKDEKKEKKRRPTVVKQETALDADQQRSLSRLEKMFGKLYGYQDVPEEAQEEVRETLWDTLNGTHMPERTRSNLMGNMLMAHLRDRNLVAADAHEMASKTAELLAQDELSREGLDGYLIDMSNVMANSLLPEPKRKEVLADLEQLIRTAKKNEEKIKERQLAKEREEEKKRKEAIKKAEEEKRKQERGGGAPRRGGRGGA